MPARTQFKTNIVERYKNGESSYKIGKDERCSYNTVLRELKRKGINTGKLWAKEEIEKLKKLYPTTSNAELLEEFPNRKRESILGMAKKLRIKKRECRKTCEGCGGEFIVKCRHERKLCPKCMKKQWERNNPKNAYKREKQWLQRNPEYMNRYYKQLRKESPKYRLDCNMGTLIYQSLKEKKGGRRWETLVDYTLKGLTEHLESQFDENMDWENYGSFWHIDHIKPRSLFRYTFAEDPEFKKCWALENLQPLERIANIRKSNTFQL